MKKKYLLLILSILQCWLAQAQLSNERPKLVVGVVVDQMRYDYLFRYYEKYGDGGFKR
ncbi:MAG: hypothetical protein HC880_08725 [Bacteroidia bacterium]|nr:hypothetical protein [Bacteroidia bacterium]